MNDTNNQIDAALAGLLESDEDQLFEQLALRADTIRMDPLAAGQYDLQTVSAGHEMMGLREDIIDAGKRIFKRTQIAAYGVVCGSDEGDEKARADLLAAFNMGETAVAAAIAGLLVSQAAIAPAVAAVVAALIIKLFFKPAYTEFCGLWKKHLPKVDEG